MIDLYTAPTPNGWKASVALEELEIPDETHFVNIGKGEQRGVAVSFALPNLSEQNESAQKEFVKNAQTMLQR